MHIRYIGQKANKHDNVANTGITWLGHGDVQDVSDPIAAAKLLANDTIWVLADPDAEGHLVPTLGEATQAEPTVPASTVRAFVTMLLEVDRLSAADLPIVCKQLGIELGDIAVPPVRAPAPPAEPVAEAEPESAPAEPSVADAPTKAARGKAKA